MLSSTLCLTQYCSLLLQCIVKSALCDNFHQCVDWSDEYTCNTFNLKGRSSKNLPVLVEFQRTGKITTSTLQPVRIIDDTVCPETHFWCPGRDHCLPVFVRCNGVYDCPDYKDEEGCDVYTCPGFYRCRTSKVCVHVSHVCDDFPQCPQYDDELLCNRPCPLHCTCLGLAFFCSQVFEARRFPDLRYLDVRGSGMGLHVLDDNSMLIHLSLAMCRIRTVTNVTLSNLHSLDLSDNLLTEVSGHHFRYMTQLTVLFLAGNPLISVFPTGSGTELLKVHRLDLSRIHMYSVDHSLFLTFPSLQYLNLSHSGVELLWWNSSVAPLRELEMLGSDLSEFPQYGLRGFPHLQLLHTDSFKFCCPSVLPPGFDISHCHATPDDVSSCDYLLGSVTYRTTIAILTAVSLLGNIISLTMRVCVGSTWRLSSSGLVLTHLSVADLGMGLHLATLWLADWLLAGHYVWQDSAWRRGAVCHLAGVLAVSCRQAATFFISVLSLDRCLHCCPVLTTSLTVIKVKVICVAIWICSILAATVPSMSQWRFFGRQALCVPLPHIRNNSLESHYAYWVLVLVQFVMFVLCCVCEVVSGVCRRVTISNIMNKDHYPNNFQFVVTGSLTSGLLYTIACLVPVNTHNNKQQAIHTALVYFGSAVSCAMNPCLHFYSVRVARSRRIKEERLLRIVSRSCL